ncbi:MAG TPA: ABC transporter substrate-binding protein [Ktedonobacteraceae bacterium]|nr:ABC transporter substrate-binding protein [Ktedonobacteraceae bacterium]
MATDELLPAACAFAVSVLAEYEQDPSGVPEEAVEAAQQHMATCIRCLSSTAGSTTPRKKKKVRRVAEVDYSPRTSGQTMVEEPEQYTLKPEAPSSVVVQEPPSQQLQQAQPLSPEKTPAAQSVASGSSLPAQGSTVTTVAPVIAKLPATTTASSGVFDCQQCRQLLPEYAEAMDSGQDVALLYPEAHAHLLSCETGCLVLLDLFRQEAKANRKYRRKPVRDPFSIIGWEITGFFRGGRVPVSPMALAYGTLILLLLVSSLAVFLSVRWDDARYYHPVAIIHTIPTPDGIGMSDGLKIYDACNASSYQDKREAAQAMQHGNTSGADKLLASAVNAPLTDTTGCNGAEAAIYREDLLVRQSGHPFGILVVSFDSGPGNANPQGGTDRHILYAAYTQELIGAFIAQQQYNSTGLQTPGAPLLYLVLANTTGTEQGALQITSEITAMSNATSLQQFGLQVQGTAPLLGVLGMGPSSLLQVALPALCRAGIPLIAPTATGLFIVNLLTQTSLYRHCAPGFAFIRFSPDDAGQSVLGASFAYNQLVARNAAVFYDPSNPSSEGSAQAFLASFPKTIRHRVVSRIVAQETAVASGLLDAAGRPQASSGDLLAGLTDALQAKPRPDLIYAPLLTNDVVVLAQTIARLPQNQQPILMISGEFVQPSAIQGLVQWARQHQLSLPRIYIIASAATHPPDNDPWQKQFYASFCTSFATPGSYCSGATALDQGALLFGDSVELLTNVLGTATNASTMPSTTSIVQHISTAHLDGVSGSIALHLWDNVLITNNSARPVILGVQQDGSIQIVG